MQITNLAVIALRIVLVVAFALLVVFQVMSMPGQFAYMAKENPDMAYLRWPLTIWSILELACFQVVIVSTWKLLTKVKDDRIFSESSFVWVDAIVGAIAAAWALFVGLFLYVGFKADDPGLPLLMFLIVVGGAVFGLLMIVMRALLRQATNLRTEMDEVL